MDYHVRVPELRSHEICWETVKGGQSKETFFVLSSEDWNMEHEGFIGLMLIVHDDYWGRHFNWSKLVQVVFDGLVYCEAISKENAIEQIGKIAFETKMQRAEAVLTLVITSELDHLYPIFPDQEQMANRIGIKV